MVKYIIPSVKTELQLERHWPDCKRFFWKKFMLSEINFEDMQEEVAGAYD